MWYDSNNRIKRRGKLKLRFFIGRKEMNELDKFLPTPPQLGPPLPGILRAYWPWVKQPPEREYVLPMTEAPKLVTAPAPTPKPAPQTQSAPAPTQKTINYEVETPPELLSPGTPTRVSPGWIGLR